MKRSTVAAHVGLGSDPRTGSISVPIYQTATFAHPALGQSTGYDYSRSGNPTREALEKGIAALDGGIRGFAFASGLAAISTLLHLFAPGDHIVVTEDLYGGTCRLFDQVFGRYGLTFTYADTTDLDAVRDALRPETRALFVESLTNPLLKAADLPALSALCRERELLHIVDNTFLTPHLLRPIEHGADVVVHSASKYLAGHNDTVAGLLVAKDEAIAERIAFHQNAVGAILGPQDSWLTIRGIKTLALRLDRQQENAAKIADFLLAHPAVTIVHFPGLPSYPSREVLSRTADGFGAMIAFEVDDKARVEQVLSRLRLIPFAESLGGVESLITYPETQTHTDIPAEVRARLGINDRLLRLSVGIEDADDLIDDLRQALEG